MIDLDYIRKEKIELTDGTSRVVFDVVSNIGTAYPVSVTSHAMEIKSSKTKVSAVTDHVKSDLGTVSLTAIIGTYERDYRADEDVRTRVERLVRWRKEGKLLSLVGYGQLSSARSAIKVDTSNPEEYMGIGAEEIEPLLISTLSVTRAASNGANVSVSITLKKVFVAVSKSPAGSNSVGQTATGTKSSPAGGNNKVKPA